MASVLTSFVSQLKQLVSLSIRFDSHLISEVVAHDFLTNCSVPTVTWFRLEVTWVCDSPPSCPLLDFVRHNKQIQHFCFAHVDLEEGRWPTIFETLSTCENLQSVAVRCITEENRAVLINGKDSFNTEGTEDITASLVEARRRITVSNSDHDDFPAARYDRYPDDSEYDSFGET